MTISCNLLDDANLRGTLCISTRIKHDLRLEPTRIGNPIQLRLEAGFDRPSMFLPFLLLRSPGACLQNAVSYAPASKWHDQYSCLVPAPSYLGDRYCQCE
eukprot:Gregarina_sp_Poly_1__2713@NODE_1748_length_3418_cov_60_246195_g1144_i0_p5_GENE_NODE_1748_length_3418_cov_60_246195_g1144_i0NODE_1748_length_3418_cov_60_246195_g1144_i0_p5_ORF_typecomplete_len100_score1_49_NODE_1748_length_3418_cov_60_246195_g1144_i0459758